MRELPAAGGVLRQGAGAAAGWTRPVVFGITGAQAAGKTTLLTRLTAIWSARGLAVAVVKHDGHLRAQAADDWEKPEADTVKLAAAGARWTILAGGGRTLLRAQPDLAADDPLRLVDRLLTLARDASLCLDIVAVEGFRSAIATAALPHIAVVRRQTDVDWLRQQTLPSLRAVFAATGLSIPVAGCDWRLYHEEGFGELAAAILHWRSV